MQTLLILLLLIGSIHAKSMSMDIEELVERLQALADISERDLGEGGSAPQDERGGSSSAQVSQSPKSPENGNSGNSNSGNGQGLGVTIQITETAVGNGKRQGPDEANNQVTQGPSQDSSGQVTQSPKSPENGNGGSGNSGSSTGSSKKIQIVETKVESQNRKFGAVAANRAIVAKNVEKRATVLAGDCPTTASSSNPCLNYGLCVSAKDGHTCLCKAGWTGSDCSQDNGASTEDPNTLFVNNGVSIWGDWMTKKKCPKSHFVTGFQIQFTGEQGNGDDTAVSRLSLLCTPPDGSTQPQSYITSGGHNWGTWKTLVSCPTDYYIVDFNQQVDPDSGGCCDDWGTANFKFTCRGPGLRGTQTQEIIGNAGGSGWGDWGNRMSSVCRPGTAVCAMQAKSVSYQGSLAWNDDAAMVDTRLWCCNFDDEPSSYVLTNFKFDIDIGKLIQQTPKAVATSTLRNEENTPQQQAPSLSYEKSTTNDWSETVGLTVGVSTSIEVGNDASFVKGTFGVSVESSYSTSWGQSVSETLTFSTTITVTVPARSISEVEVVLTEAIMDIPYTADLTTYFVGSTKTDVRKISGVWKGVRAIKTVGIIKQSVPIV